MSGANGGVERSETVPVPELTRSRQEAPPQQGNRRHNRENDATTGKTTPQQGNRRHSRENDAAPRKGVTVVRRGEGCAKGCQKGTGEGATG